MTNRQSLALDAIDLFLQAAPRELGAQLWMMRKLLFADWNAEGHNKFKFVFEGFVSDELAQCK